MSSVGIQSQGRSLFGTAVEDLQRTFRRFSTERSFATMSKFYFGDLFARTLCFFVEKELSKCAGAGQSLQMVGSAADFAQALDVYARQSARIMETFAEDGTGNITGNRKAPLAMCAAVEAIALEQGQPVKVSHRPTPPTQSRQKALVEPVQRQFPHRRIPHLSFCIHRIGSNAEDISIGARGVMRRTLGVVDCA
jgi:hypothetical protein